MIVLHILVSNSNSFEKIRNTFGDAGQRVESWWKVHLENNDSEHKGGFFISLFLSLGIYLVQLI